MLDPFVKLNVGGQIFTTSRGTLQQMSDSMLAKMFGGEMSNHRDEQGCYFIDRDPKHFGTILNFMRDGICSLPADGRQREELLLEARFFQLDGLEALLVPPAQAMRQRIWAQIREDKQLQTIVQRILRVAFQEPYHIKQVAIKQFEETVMRLTCSTEMVQLKGPVAEEVHYVQDDREGYEQALILHRYVYHHHRTLSRIMLEQGYKLVVGHLPSHWSTQSSFEIFLYLPE